MLNFKIWLYFSLFLMTSFRNGLQDHLAPLTKLVDMNEVERPRSRRCVCLKLKTETFSLHLLSDTQPRGPSHLQEKLGDTITRWIWMERARDENVTDEVSCSRTATKGRPKSAVEIVPIQLPSIAPPARGRASDQYLVGPNPTPATSQLL